MNLGKARAKSKVIVLLTLLVLTTFLGMARVSATSSWTDTFKDTSEGGYASRWNTWHFGTGTTSGFAHVDVGYNRLLIDIWYGAGSTDNTYGIGITLKDTIMNLQGDFVVQVDYNLLFWNPSNVNTHLRIGLGVTRPVSEDTWMWGERISENSHYGGDSHINHNSNQYIAVSPEVTATGTTGTIQLQRTGDEVYASITDSSHTSWTDIGHVTLGTGDLSPELGFWIWQSDGSVMGDVFQIAFSNFSIVSDVFVVPEAPFGALLAVAACFAAFAIIKRPKLNLRHN